MPKKEDPFQFSHKYPHLSKYTSLVPYFIDFRKHKPIELADVGTLHNAQTEYFDTEEFKEFVKEMSKELHKFKKEVLKKAASGP